MENTGHCLDLCEAKRESGPIQPLQAPPQRYPGEDDLGRCPFFQLVSSKRQRDSLQRLDTGLGGVWERGAGGHFTRLISPNPKATLDPSDDREPPPSGEYL